MSDTFFQAHTEPQLGGKEALQKYLLKEGEYAEKGEQVLCSKGMENVEGVQGKRNDLDEIEELLNSGATPDEIFEMAFRYRKYEKMIKSAYLAKRIKEMPLKKKMWNEYHWGKSGTGKTHTYLELEEANPGEVYLCNDYANSGGSGGGFDYYMDDPARIIVLDEFRGQMSYAQLMSILDVYSRNQIHCRYQNVIALWEQVYICSIYPPEAVYSFMVAETKRKIDSMYQMMRRFNVIVYHYINKDGKYRTFSMPGIDYVDAADMVKKAMENEKTADEREAMQEALEKLEETERQMSLDEFKETWGAVEVDGQAEVSQDVTGERKN